MKSEAIFAPVCVLALWTGLVLLLTGFKRIRAVRARRLRAEAFRLGESEEVPAEIAVMNRNLMNLLEMPVLFYVVCISLYVTHLVSTGLLGLAWVYVALRLAHSLIHVTTNRVTHRVSVFALSNFVLLALWLCFMARVL